MASLNKDKPKKYDPSFGPLPPKAYEYLAAQKEVKKYKELQKQDYIHDIMTGDDNPKHHKFKGLDRNKTLLSRLETELMTSTHIYRNDDHKSAVITYLFPHIRIVYYDKDGNEVKKEEKEKKVEAPAPKPQKIEKKKEEAKPSNDVWDLY
jgi:hypothetical protein